MYYSVMTQENSEKEIPSAQESNLKRNVLSLVANKLILSQS